MCGGRVSTGSGSRGWPRGHLHTPSSRSSREDFVFACVDTHLFLHIGLYSRRTAGSHVRVYVLVLSSQVPSLRLNLITKPLSSWRSVEGASFASSLGPGTVTSGGKVASTISAPFPRSFAETGFDFGAKDTVLEILEILEITTKMRHAISSRTRDNYTV